MKFNKHNFLPFFILILFLVNSVYAWNLQSHIGNWEVLYNYAWKTPEKTSSETFEATWTNTITNFSNWVFALHSFVFCENLEWYQWFTFGYKVCEHYVYLNVTSGSENIAIKFYHRAYKDWTNLGVGFVDIDVWIYYYETEEWIQLYHGYNIPLEFFKKQSYDFRFYFAKANNETLTFTIVGLTDRDSNERVMDNISHDFNVTSGFWNSVTLTQYVIKEGRGMVEAYKDSEKINDPDFMIPYEEEADTNWWLWNIFQALTSPIYDMLPNWARNIADIFGGIAFVCVDTVLPNLGVIIGLALVTYFTLSFVNFSSSVTEIDELSITSIIDNFFGSFEPLFNIFFWIGSTILGIAHFIADIVGHLIPF